MDTGNRLDKATYDVARPYLEAALEHIIAAGRSVKDLAEFATDKFGSSFYPYLREFQQDIRAGKIRVRGLQTPAKTSIFGKHIDTAQRERMIREAAYLKAERRGFTGGSPQEDWLSAEAEIDESLAREAGLFERGNQAKASAKTTAETEYGSIRDVVGSWIQGKWQKGDVPADSTTEKIPTSRTPMVAAGSEESADTSKPEPGAAKANAHATQGTADTRGTEQPDSGSDAKMLVETATEPSQEKPPIGSPQEKTVPGKRQSTRGARRAARGKLTASRKPR